MSIEIKIIAKDLDHLKEQVIELAASYREPLSLSVNTKKTVEVEDIDPTEDQEDEEKPVKKKKKKVSKKKKTAPKEAPKKEAVSRETVQDALKKVNEAHGIEKVKEVLQSFGANRLSDLQEDQLQDFQDACLAAAA